MGLLGLTVSPLLWSILLMFGGVFNVHVADLGETYVARNIGSWAAICLSLVLLWWRPMKQATIAWSPLWLGGLFLPVIGAVFVLAVNIIGSFEHLHVGHYFMPLMLLAFAMFVLGLRQHDDALPDLGLVTIAIFIAFLPQYLIYLVSENPLIGLFSPPFSFVMPSAFNKPYAGFGQYNLLGSQNATLLVMAATAFALLPMGKMRRFILGFVLVALALDLPFTPSKTALLGIFIGLVFLAAHIFIKARQCETVIRFAMALTLLVVTYIVVILVANLSGVDAELAKRTMAANQSSFQFRSAMWVVGFWGFIEQPIFGGGMGSYLSIYMEQFGRFGQDEELAFLELATVPHNLFIHIISEMGLFGLVVIMGPFIWFGLRLFHDADNRWVLAALLFPILLHTQFEYPYIASGSHYWLFGVALVLALFVGGVKQPLSHKAALPNKSTARLAFAGLTVFSAAGVFISIMLMLDVHRSTLSFARATSLPLENYIEDRANAPELSHPILGKRLRAIANLHLMNMIMIEERYDMLRPVAMPYFEKYVLTQYPTPPVWELGLRAYFVLREYEKFHALVDYMALYQPQKAEEFRTNFEAYLALEASPPQ